MKRSSGAPRRKCARGVEILRATELNIRLRPTAMPVTGSGATSSAFARLQCRLRAPARQVPPSPDCNGVSGFGGTSAHPDIHRRDTDERQVESGVEQTNRKSTPDV